MNLYSPCGGRPFVLLNSTDTTSAKRAAPKNEGNIYPILPLMLLRARDSRRTALRAPISGGMDPVLRVAQGETLMVFGDATRSRKHMSTQGCVESLASMMPGLAVANHDTERC